MRSVAQNVYCALFIFACLSFRAAPPVAGQVLYGSLVGNVTDSAGAAAPGAKVSIKQAGANLTREAITNEVGLYSFSTLPAGRYEIRVARDGFMIFQQSGVEISINATTRVDVALQVGPMSETVLVSAAPPALQTDRSEVRAELGARQMRDLPIPPGRNYQALFKLIPGMSPPNNLNTVAADPSRSLVFNTNGASRSSNNFRIDGSGVNAVWLPHNAGYTPTLEAIETVSVVTNSFDAEQGLAGGSASNLLIKSGTNAIHGSAFEFNSNNATKAKPFILPAGQRKPKSIFNQFGATIGGPILRDKLFYFGSYEGTTDRQNASAFATVPTEAMRRGDLSGSPTLIYDPATGAADGSGRMAFTGNQIPAARIDQIAQRILNRLPLPNVADALTNNYFATGPYRVNRHKTDSKITWTANNKFSLFGRFSLLEYNLATDGVFGELEGPPFMSAAGSAGKGFGKTYNVAVGGTYVFSSDFVIDANFGYTLQETNQEQPNLDKNIGRDELGIPGTNGARRFEGGWPRFVITNYTTIGHSTANRPIIWRDPRFQYTANATWTRDSHNIRFGTDLSRQHLNHAQPEFVGQLHGASGGFTFSGHVTTLRGGPSANQFNSIAAFLLGLPSSLGRTLQVPDQYTTRAWTNSLYARDQWQATRKLTVSYGARWEYFPMPTREDRGLERYDPVTNKMLICGVGSVPSDCGVEQSKKLFAPRLGLAYRATDTFVMRAGYGVSIDPYSLSRPMRTNFPVLVALNVNGANAFQAAGSLETGIPTITPPDLSSGIIDIPGNVAANTLSDKLPRGYIQSWNLTLQKEVGARFVAQAAYVATRQIRQLGFLDINGGRPGGGAASQPLNQKFGRTATTPLVTGIGNTHYDSLQLSVERRFRQGLHMQSSYTLSKSIGICCNDDSDGAVAIPLPDFYQLNRAVSSFDRRHNYQLSTIYELPLGKGKRWAKEGGPAALLGGWQINGIFSAYSGAPFTVTAAGASLNAPGSTQRADQIKSGVTYPRGTGRGQLWFDPLAFAPVIAARFGDVGFNTLRGPGYANFDLGLFRKFKFGERIGLQFRAEAFNFTNTPHFANPGNNVSNLQLNPDGSIRNLGGFSEITSVASLGRDGIDERVFRFGLRASF